jgi:hypothetical protein
VWCGSEDIVTTETMATIRSILTVGIVAAVVTVIRVTEVILLLLYWLYNSVWALASPMFLLHRLWRFRNNRFFGGRVISPTPNP